MALMHKTKIYERDILTGVCHVHNDDDNDTYIQTSYL